MSAPAAPSSTRARGAAAEAAAAAFLERRGWRIVARNYRSREGEVDLVATDGRILAFVEVKSSRDDDHGSPLERVGAAKQRTIVRVARHFLARHGDLAASLDVRFDVVALRAPGTAEEQMVHLEDAFRAG